MDCFARAVFVVAASHAEPDAGAAAPVGVADRDSRRINAPVLWALRRLATLDERPQASIDVRSGGDAWQQSAERQRRSLLVERHAEWMIPEPMELELAARHLAERPEHTALGVRLEHTPNHTQRRHDQCPYAMQPGSILPRKPGGFCVPCQNSRFAWQLMTVETRSFA